MPVRSIVVTGASGPLARRVVDRIGPDRAVFDEHAGTVAASTVVDLGWGAGPSRAATLRTLAAADSAGVKAVVHLSSAIVYGGWSDNAIPLTEEAAIRPNPGVSDAVHHAEAERIVADWADAHPDVTVCVLRPATPLGPGVDGSLARAVGARSSWRRRHLDPPRQFVHIDDLASAVAFAATRELAGVFNVAADGWIGGEQVRDLGPGALKNLPWKLRLSTLPPEVSPLVEQPWVVANDRLRAAGWVPAYTNEEAVVAGTAGSRWREMSPSRRQEVALAGASVTLLGGAAAAVAAVRARRR
ncbi:MAG: hypothetical protein NVSMB12_19360 [Acidimicrobiales bacterium]